MSAAPTAPPPSYSEIMQGQGYQGYPTSYGAVSPPPSTTGYQPAGMAYPPAGDYDPKKTTPTYPAGSYPANAAYPAQTSYPPHAAYPAQAGYPAQPRFPPPAGSVPAYGQAHTTQTSLHVHPAQTVVVVGGCPACRVGVLEEDFTCLGVLCAILFFPLGILCCLALRQRRCSHCGAVFG